MNAAPTVPVADALGPTEEAAVPLRKPNRKQRRAGEAVMQRIGRRRERKAVRDAKKRGLRGANGIAEGYRGVEKRLRRSERIVGTSTRLLDAAGVDAVADEVAPPMAGEAPRSLEDIVGVGA